MAEMNVNNNERIMKIRHRGRGSQVWIYLGKLLRMFIYQNDWKVLPMSALIAGLVGMVIRKRFLINMEGTLMGAFALVCVCIWNGCFNSIQVICRERDVIKREHRSGMHISSYICSHMIYQALLCIMQTVVTIMVSQYAGIKYENGVPLVTHYFLVDIGISMFLITFASDMLSLWVSTIAHTTTTAMTIMPFILIFQLVFSGGMLSLPEWTKVITPFTISNPALKLLATQGDYNGRELVTIWNQLVKFRDKTDEEGKPLEYDVTVTLGQVLDKLQSTDIPLVNQLRSIKLTDLPVDSSILEALGNDELIALLNAKSDHKLTLGELLDTDAFKKNYAQYDSDRQALEETTIGAVVDMMAANENIKAHRDASKTIPLTINDVIQTIGEDKVSDILKHKLAEASAVDDYEFDVYNVIEYWMSLIGFIFVFAALATITLEFIDKDKR